MKYSSRRSSRIPKRLLILAAVLLVILAAAVGVVRHQYHENLKPVSNDQRTQIITITSGSSVQQIADQLAERKVIHNSWVFQWYVHSKELSAKLQAGTYAISPSQDIPTIVSTLTKGKVAHQLVTILPGRRIDQVRADLINDGFGVDAVDAALQPSRYRDLPVMAYVPTTATSLEGLLYPDSFERTDQTDPSDIIRQSLNEMEQHLSTSRQAQFAQHGLNVYQGLTLASVVEQEVAKQSDRDQVAQVFLLRLQKGMTLGSDVTARYGAIVAGKKPSVTYDSPYNTRIHQGLPIGPISTVSESSLQSVAQPAATDWLYFVAGDDGTTHFAHTLDEHQANVNQYCHEKCSE